jgi:hypothetical protein
MNQTPNRAPSQALNQTSDQTANRTSDQTLTQTSDRTSDQTSDHTLTQTSDQPATRPQTQPSVTPPQRPPLTGQDIAETQGALRALLETNLARAGASADGYIVLRVLALRGPIEPAEFHDYLTGQRQLGLDRPGVAALLAGLEADALITGSAPDGPGPVQLTDRGIARHAELAALIVPATTQVFAGLDPTDLAVTHRVLLQLTEQAEQVRSSM